MPSHQRRAVIRLDLEGVSPDAAAMLFRGDRDDGVVIAVAEVSSGANFDGTTAVTLAVSWSVGIGTGVVANAIYDSVRHGWRRAQVGDRKVLPTRKALEEALCEAQQILDAIDENELGDHEW